MEKYPKWIVEDLVRIAAEAIDEVRSEHPDNATLLEDRFEAALIALDDAGVDKSFLKCFKSH